MHPLSNNKSNYCVTIFIHAKLQKHKLFRNIKKIKKSLEHLN